MLFTSVLDTSPTSRIFAGLNHRRMRINDYEMLDVPSRSFQTSSTTLYIDLLTVPQIEAGIRDALVVSRKTSIRVYTSREAKLIADMSLKLFDCNTIHS